MPLRGGGPPSPLAARGGRAAAVPGVPAALLPGGFALVDVRLRRSFFAALSLRLPRPEKTPADDSAAADSDDSLFCCTSVHPVSALFLAKS